MRKILLAITSVLTIMIAGIIVVFGQDTERSSFIQFVEEQNSKDLWISHSSPHLIESPNPHL